MSRLSIALGLAVLTASTVNAQPRSASLANELGLRGSSNATVAEAVARVRIEQSGYYDVHGVIPVSNGGWQAVARGADRVPVVVTVAPDGKVVELR